MHGNVSFVGAQPKKMVNINQSSYIKYTNNIPYLLNRPEKQELKARAFDKRGVIIIYKKMNLKW